MFGRVLDTGIVFGILIIIVFVAMTLANSADTKQVVQNEPVNIQKETEPVQQEKSTSLHTPQEVENLVKEYKGKDNSGQTLSEIITMLVITAYPGEDILENPSTDWGFSAMPMSGDPDIDRRWDAKFYLKTYRENTHFEWSVDMETKSIYAKNELGKSVLDALDAYD